MCQMRINNTHLTFKLNFIKRYVPMRYLSGSYLKKNKQFTVHQNKTSSATEKLPLL